MLRSARRLLGKRIGAVIVEFALVVPFLFLIVFGIIDFSRAYAQLNNINSSLREGARYGTTPSWSSGPPPSLTWHNARRSPVRPPASSWV